MEEGGLLLQIYTLVVGTIPSVLLLDMGKRRRERVVNTHHQQPREMNRYVNL